MQPFQIWLAEHEFNDCTDRRPWLIIAEPQADSVACFPLSTQCYDGTAFPLGPDDEGFDLTGLDRPSYIHDEKIYELPPEAFIKQLGSLSGPLLDRFRESSGI